jgi:hypothetical protein
MFMMTEDDLRRHGLERCLQARKESRQVGRAQGLRREERFGQAASHGIPDHFHLRKGTSRKKPIFGRLGGESGLGGKSVAELNPRLQLPSCNTQKESRFSNEVDKALGCCFMQVLKKCMGL